MNNRQGVNRVSTFGMLAGLEGGPATFKESFTRRFLVRLHMSLILAAVSASGVITSKLLLTFGLTSLRTRYLAAVLFSYVVFFLLVRLWLWYVSASIPGQRSQESSSDALDLNPFDAIDVAIDAATDGGCVPPSPGPEFGGGGDFGGGGATDHWGDAAPENFRSLNVATRPGSSPSTPVSGSKVASKGGGLGLDLDDAGIVLVVFGLLVLVIFGAGVYLVWEAPVILSEAAFQALLATSLAGTSKRITQPGWVGSVFKATWLPLVIVVAMTVVFGWVAHHYCPEAMKIADVIRGCGNQN
jgi:hypothetical protein